MPSTLNVCQQFTHPSRLGPFPRPAFLREDCSGICQQQKTSETTEVRTFFLTWTVRKTDTFGHSRITLFKQFLQRSLGGLKMFNVILPTFQSHLTVWPLDPDDCKHCRNSIRMKLAPWIVKLLVSVANLLKFLLGPRKRYDQPPKGEIIKNYDQW